MEASTGKFQSREGEAGCCNITLKDAVRYALKRCLAQPLSDDALLLGLCAQIVKKWNHAADEYQADHPGELPLFGLGKGHRSFGRLLPIKVAEKKMATWFPWANIKLKRECERLAAMFDTLTDEQLRAVELEPEIESQDDSE